MTATLFTEANYNLGGKMREIAHGHIGIPDLRGYFLFPNAGVNGIAAEIRRKPASPGFSNIAEPCT
ncbi:MAG: hypothetical protein JNJ60_21955 [Rhodocyclaceae bacterium]|nr:hypothetical protein [Rhodocyclaceae bacterium]